MAALESLGKIYLTITVTGLLLIGVLAIGYGIYSLYMNATDPHAPIDVHFARGNGGYGTIAIGVFLIWFGTVLYNSRVNNNRFLRLEGISAIFNFFKF